MFQYIAVNKHKIIQSFWGVYIGIVLLYLWGAYAIISKNSQSLFFYKLGLTAGRLALVLFCIVLIPGIARRLSLRYRWASIIMWFRRQLGISVFLLGFTHYSFLKLIPLISTTSSSPPTLLFFEQLGFFALILMFFLFITSNDLSLRLLKQWWYKLHKVIYIIAWLLFGHTVLQGISFYSVLIGLAATLEVVSLVYVTVKRRMQK